MKVRSSLIVLFGGFILADMYELYMNDIFGNYEIKVLTRISISRSNDKKVLHDLTFHKIVREDVVVDPSFWGPLYVLGKMMLVRQEFNDIVR